MLRTGNGKEMLDSAVSYSSNRPTALATSVDETVDPNQRVARAAPEEINSCAVSDINDVGALAALSSDTTGGVSH